MKLYALERPLKGQFYLGRVSFLITEIFNQLTSLTSCFRPVKPVTLAIPWIVITAVVLYTSHILA